MQTERFLLDVKSTAVDYIGTKEPTLAMSLGARRTWRGGGLDAPQPETRYNGIMQTLKTIAKEVTDTGRKEKPLVALIDPIMPGAAAEEFLISNDNTGYFMDYSGVPSRSESLTWSAVPMDVSCLHPYVVTMLPNKVDVHNVKTLTLAESITVPGCRAMHLTTFPIGQVNRTVNQTHRPRKRVSTMLISSGKLGKKTSHPQTWVLPFKIIIVDEDKTHDNFL